MCLLENLLANGLGMFYPRWVVVEFFLYEGRFRVILKLLYK